MNGQGSAQNPVLKQRLSSLDALRGLDMLCIIGGDAVIHEAARLWPGPALGALAVQFEHVGWEGLHVYDLIFPLFIFLSGVAIPLSMDARMVRSASRRPLWGKIAMRTVLLLVLGIIYNGLLADEPQAPRLPSVLGQIGLAWGIAASIYLIVRDNRARAAVLLGWLVGVAILQLLVPVPGHGAGVLTKIGALNTWLDRTILPGRLHRGTFDPEGLLCCVSAASVAMAGALAGVLLKRPYARSWRTVALLAGSGSTAVLLGLLCWALGYPPIKALWTSTFNLLAIGISTLLLALFFGIIDVARVKSWSFPLTLIGLNSLTVYLAARLVSFREMSGFLFGRLAGNSGNAGPLVVACGVILLELLMLYFLYRRQWFLKL